ncbi:MAG: hypothetical protein HY461_00045 [Parcubacteria group bacterium]|nr:hypothetical protein [Parcubacteria group bacterium]
MSTLAKLPFSSFSLTGAHNHGVGRSWQLDIDLEADRPMKFFGLSVFYDGPLDNPAALDELTQRILDTIRYHKQLLAGHNVSVTNDDFFEQCLQKINAEMNVFLRDWNGPLPIQTWGMALGMITPDTTPGRLQFFVSRFGEAGAWLLHAAQLDTKKMINIFDAPDPLISTSGPKKFFKNILSSTLSQQDQLLFCTPNLFNYASLTDVKKILTTLSVSSALKQMENHVQEALDDSVAAGLSLRLSPYPFVERSVSRQKSDDTVQRSMQTLVKTEADTEHLLASTVGVNFKRFSSAFKRLTSALHRYSEDDDKNIVGSRTGGRQPSWVKPFVKPVLRFVRSVGGAASRLFPARPEAQRSSAKSPIGSADMISTHRTVTKVSSTTRRLLSAFGSRSSFSAGAGAHAASLARSPKTYLVALLAIILIGGGLYWNSVRAEKAQVLAAAQEGLARVSADLDRVDSYLIVGRETDALNLVRAVETELAAVSDVPDVQTQRERLAQRISEQRRRLRREITVRAPAVLISDLSAQLQSSPREIAATDKGFIVFGENPRHVLEYIRQDNKTTTRAITTDVNQWIEAAWLEADQLAFTDGKNVTTANFRKGTSVTQNTNQVAPLGALTSYNDRLYALSPTERQIIRSNRNPNLAVLAPWLKTADEALAQGRDLAIDGSIYVLVPDGLRVYNQGVPAPGLTLDAVEPALSNASRLAYTAGSTHFFIVENKRLLVYQKSGKFVAQYILEGGQDLRDAVVDEASKTAYVLTDSQLLTFPVQI